MHRFFISKEQIPAITGADAHQIKDVLRMKVGSELELLDGSGKIYAAKISAIGKGKIECAILSTRSEGTEPKIKVTLAQCLPKAKKMAFIIQKCTELGADNIVPVLSERSVARGEKPERWKKIAKEAAEQCGRASIPEISPLIKFNEVLKLKEKFDLALIPWELEKQTTLKQVLRIFPISPSLSPPSPIPRPPIPQFPHILVLIGPEGGFSQKELGLAKQAGFTPVTIGKTILRSETAGMAVLAAIMYELG